MRQGRVAFGAAQVLKDDNLPPLTGPESAASPACRSSFPYIFFQSIARYRASCSGKQRSNSIEYSALSNG
jgi:hypothetical protein